MKKLIEILMWPLELLDALVERHKAIRRFLVLWAVWLITVVTNEIVIVVSSMDEITPSVASFYLGVTALLTAVIGFYQFMRGKDDDKHDN